MATCRGMDVSAYQGTQDWAAHRRDGIVFAFAKASEGQTSRDGRFATHITGIIKAGLVPGAYHFAWPNQDPKVEAANYIAAVKPHAGKGFTHWLDLERYSDGRNYAGRTASQIKAWATAWIAAVRAAFPGQRVGVYTSADDIAKGHVPAGVELWYPAYPWGPAAYSRAEAAAQPRVSGRLPLIWQFTSQPIDRSIAYLSAADFRAWAAGSDQEDNMPTADEIAAAVVTKLIAGGGVLENSDLDRVVKKVFTTDDLLAAPADASDYATNKFWTFQTHVQDQTAKGRAALALLTAQKATIDELVKAVATLAAGIGDLDPAAIVRELTAAIESIDIHLDVPNA